jgi:hypothetical protein
MAFSPHSYPLRPEQHQQLQVTTKQAAVLGVAQQYLVAQTATLQRLEQLDDFAGGDAAVVREEDIRFRRVALATQQAIFAAIEADAYFAFGVSPVTPNNQSAAELYLLKVDKNNGNPLRQSHVQIGSAVMRPTLHYTGGNGFDTLTTYYGLQRVIEQHQAGLDYSEFGSVATFGWLLES